MILAKNGYSQPISFVERNVLLENGMKTLANGQ